MDAAAISGVQHDVAEAFVEDQITRNEFVQRYFAKRCGLGHGVVIHRNSGRLLPSPHRETRAIEANAGRCAVPDVGQPNLGASDAHSGFTQGLGTGRRRAKKNTG